MKSTKGKYVTGIYYDSKIIAAARDEFEWIKVKTIPTSFYERILLFFGFMKRSVKIKIKKRRLKDLIPRLKLNNVYPEAIYKIK